MKIKSVAMEQKQYKFGLSPSNSISRNMSGSIGTNGEDWQMTYKENGWRNLLFFHPAVSYKEYKQDKDLINQMEGEKIYEVALSFDKPYKQSELPLYELPAMTWFWINTYTDSQLNQFQQETKENDWSSTFIRENEALGLSVNSSIFSSIELDQENKDFLRLLKTSISDEHTSVYKTMKDKNINDVEILGMVVYGTKEEVATFIDNPIVKSSSLGGFIGNH
ncbi:Sigma factor regulator C-terminal [Carnobacterium iners]|uniref:Sigma factor regulator C-terminal n=1 Tax=Carnobacterium iners TaxID=1073423 RepID=A0A1X7MTF1_9LACT|nr:anti sigma factor C-terminal domain-containing protein [Carnobacterium iners]SEK57814.1 Sigma factor regulator C-terminal [Carnobacterium iners]SMH28092.1 Sigma factor regulator C-terminal [Carnobacterium iners]